MGKSEWNSTTMRYLGDANESRQKAETRDATAYKSTASARIVKEEEWQAAMNEIGAAHSDRKNMHPEEFIPTQLHKKNTPIKCLVHLLKQSQMLHEQSLSGQRILPLPSYPFVLDPYLPRG